MTHLTALFTLAWRPLLDPLPLDDYWMWLMIPMVAAIAIVYKAIKLDDLTQLPRQAAGLALQFIILMAAAAAALYIITELA